MFFLQKLDLFWLLLYTFTMLKNLFLTSMNIIIEAIKFIINKFFDNVKPYEVKK